MRALLVTHDFLPRHRAGVELHAMGLARALRARGLEVRLFTTEKDPARADGSVTELAVEGLDVYQMVRNRDFRSFRESWEFEPAEAAFGTLLGAWAPQVVHFHHLLYLSLGLPEAARRSGAATLMTLHDFWLQCRLMGQRLDPWGRICEDVNANLCGRCLAARPEERSSTAVRLGRFALRIPRRLGLDLGRLARAGALRLKRTAPDAASPAEPDPAASQAAAREIEARWQAVLSHVVPAIDLFLSPSRFLMQELARFGLPRERLRFLPYGLDPISVKRIAKTGPVRFAFFGTMAPHKGAHVLLEAFRGLAGRAALDLHGGAYQPAYGRLIARLAREVGATWHGLFTPERLPELLGSCDCVVVPSLWYENSPFTLLQARQAGIPVVTSALGGMAELAAAGGAWTFPVGDAGALRVLLARLAEEPELLENALVPAVPTMESIAAEVAELYAGLAERRRP